MTGLDGHDGDVLWLAVHGSAVGNLLMGQKDVIRCHSVCWDVLLGSVIIKSVGGWGRSINVMASVASSVAASSAVVMRWSL